MSPLPVRLGCGLIVAALPLAVLTGCRSSEFRRDEVVDLVSDVGSRLTRDDRYRDRPYYDSGRRLYYDSDRPIPGPPPGEVVGDRYRDGYRRGYGPGWRDRRYGGEGRYRRDVDLGRREYRNDFFDDFR